MAIGFASDIRPLFRDVDIGHMTFFCDLSRYDDVKANAQEILDRLKATNNSVMPPKNSGGPWSVDNLATFESWIAGGLPALGSLLPCGPFLLNGTCFAQCENSGSRPGAALGWSAVRALLDHGPTETNQPSPILLRRR